MKIIALDENKSKYDEVYVVVKRINEMANKGNEVVIINTDSCLKPITP
jgi:DNA-directed RNA polymerase subunit K/omega